MIKVMRLIFVLIAITKLTIATAQVTETGFLDRSIEVGGNEFRYQVFVPRNYDGSDSLPVILALHGGGERGSDGIGQTGQWSLGKAVRREPDHFPAIIIFPQARREGQGWHGLDGQAALATLDQTLSEFNIDN